MAPPGLEPGRPKTHDFKSCASTNSAKGPRFGAIDAYRVVLGEKTEYTQFVRTRNPRVLISCIIYSMFNRLHIGRDSKTPNM